MTLDYDCRLLSSGNGNVVVSGNHSKNTGNGHKVLEATTLQENPYTQRRNVA